MKQPLPKKIVHTSVNVFIALLVLYPLLVILCSLFTAPFGADSLSDIVQAGLVVSIILLLGCYSIGMFTGGCFLFPFASGFLIFLIMGALSVSLSVLCYKKGNIKSLNQIAKSTFILSMVFYIICVIGSFAS